MKKLIVLLVLLAPLPLVAQINLPTGNGWHVLSSSSTCGSGPCAGTVLKGGSQDPGNPSNGQYTDNSQTTTQVYEGSGFTANLVVWFGAWGGGWADDVNQQLCLFGGGHGNSEINFVPCVSLNGANGPTWTTLSAQTIPVPINGNSKDYECADSNNHWVYTSLSSGTNYGSSGSQADVSFNVGPCLTPSARHVYENVNWIPDQGYMMMTCCFVMNNAGGTLETWKLNGATGVWTRDSTCCLVKPDGGQHLSAYDPTTHKLWSMGTSSAYTYNTTNNTWSGSIAVAMQAAGEIGIDTDNHILITTNTNGTGGNNASWPLTQSSVQLYAYDLNNSNAPINNGSDPLNPLDHDWNHNNFAGCLGGVAQNSGMQYDTALHLFVVYPGGGNNLMFINTSLTPVVTAYGTVPAQGCFQFTLGSVKGTDYPNDPDTVTGAGNCGTNTTCMVGLNGRFGYFPTENVFVMANAVDNPVWVLRLAPNPPANPMSSIVTGGVVVSGGAVIK